MIIQTAYRYLATTDMYMSVSYNIAKMSKYVIEAYNFCREAGALSVKLNPTRLVLEEEILNISIGDDPVEVITAQHGEVSVEIEVELSGRTTLLFQCDHLENIGYIVLFNGFEPFNEELGCQPVKLANVMETNLVAFAWNHLVKTENGCVVTSDNDDLEILIEIILKTEGKLQPDQMRELYESAMYELGTGLTVAEAVAEAMIQ